MKNAIDINQLLTQEIWQQLKKHDVSWLSSLHQLFPQKISQALSVPHKIEPTSILYAMQFSDTHFVWLESNLDTTFLFDYSLEDSLFLCNGKRAQSKDLKRLFFRLNSWIEKTSHHRLMIGAQNLEDTIDPPIERILQFLNVHHQDLRCDNISDICWKSVPSDKNSHVADSLTHILDVLKTFRRKEKRTESLQQVFDVVGSILKQQNLSANKTLLLTNQYCTHSDTVYSAKLSVHTLTYTEKNSIQKTSVFVNVENQTLNMNDSPIKLSAVSWFLNNCTQMGRDLDSGRAQLFESI